MEKEAEAKTVHQENWRVYFILFLFIKTTALERSFLHKIFYLDELHYVYTMCFFLFSAPWR